jgi:hypothetical protein
MNGSVTPQDRFFTKHKEKYIFLGGILKMIPDERSHILL